MYWQPPPYYDEAPDDFRQHPTYRKLKEPLDRLLVELYVEARWREDGSKTAAHEGVYKYRSADNFFTSHPKNLRQALMQQVVSFPDDLVMQLQSFRHSFDESVMAERVVLERMAKLSGQDTSKEK